MLPDYSDIRAAAGRDPDWHDENGVPRYAPFHPDMLGVYDRFALLVEIACQACSRPMLVGHGWSIYEQYLRPSRGDAEPEPWTLAYLAKGYRYGDPPWHSCGGAGTSMSSIGLRIVEAWERSRMEWARDREVERTVILPDWAADLT